MSPMHKHPSGDLIYLDSPSEAGPRIISGTTSYDCLITGTKRHRKNLPSPSTVSLESDDSAYNGHGTGSDNSPFSQSPQQVQKMIAYPRPQSRKLSRFSAIPPPLYQQPEPTSRPESLDVQLGVRSAPTSRPTSRPSTPRVSEATVSLQSLSGMDSPLSSPKTPIIADTKMFLIDTPIEYTDNHPPLIVLPSRDKLHSVTDIVKEFDEDLHL